MTLWKVHRYYDKNDEIYYDVVPYDFFGHIKCCIKWYGLQGLKYTYLSKKKAEKIAYVLTTEINIMKERLQ